MGVDLLFASPQLCRGSVLFSPPALNTSGCAVPFLLSNESTAVLLRAWLYTWLSTSARIKNKSQIHDQEGIQEWEEKY